MTESFRRIASWFALVMLGLATAAIAQEVSSFRDLHGSLKEGERLIITEPSGVNRKVRFVALSDQSLRVMARSARFVDLPAASVAKIDQLRSRKAKGALVGLIAGAAVGAFAVALTPSCTGFGCVGPGTAAAIPLAAALFGGIGAAIGTGVGAMRPQHRLIYVRPVETADRTSPIAR